MKDILGSGVRRVFEIPDKAPSSSMAWRLGNAEYHIQEALSTMLSHADALRVAVALHNYADLVERTSGEIEARRIAGSEPGDT